MFLGSLNQRQKELFIQLCIHAALANGIIESEESILIDEYCKEMAIDNPGTKASISMKDALLELKSISSTQELNIITFEIAAIFVSDGEYTEDEIYFMDELTNAFNIDEEKAEKMINQIEEYNFLFK
jgi:uncharacterized membrane protein YebE (DUF533 family)